MQHTVYLFDGFQLDVTRRKLVSSGGLVQPLSTRAMDALLLLVANAGELIEKRRLMQTVWPSAIVEDNNLNQCIVAIRKALGEAAGSNRYVMTVPGRGYRFVSPVRVVQQESAAQDTVHAPPRIRPGRRPWVAGVAIAAAGALAAAVLLHGARDAASVQAVGRYPGTAPGSTPAVVLRLRESPAAPGMAEPVAGSTAMLADCLAAHPHMRLRVRVQLLDAGDVPAWTGDYVAGTEDVLALQAGSQAGPARCRESLAAAKQKAPPESGGALLQ